MYFTRNMKAVGVILIASACLFPSAASAAKLPSKSVTKTARVKSKTKAKNLPNRIHIVPTATVYSASPDQRPKKKLSAAQRSAKTLKVTSPKLSKIKSATLRASNSDTPSVGSPKSTRSTKSVALKPTIAANASGLSSVRPKVSGFQDIAQRAGRIRTKVSDQVGRDLNSGSAAAIGNAMPGFADRGAKGAKGLRGLGSTGDGNNHNPVTGAGGLSDFAGGGSGRYSEGGKGSATATHHQDGSTTLKYADGTTIDVWKDGTIVTENPDGTTEVDSSNNSPTKVYDKDGKYVGTKPGTGTAGGGQGTKEPIDDATGSGGSGRPVVTAESLRGLNSRRTSMGEPTGDEGTSGGQVDDSKTRTGRISQVGQPTADGAATRLVPTAADVQQVMRIRLRNVTPIAH